jgi:DUF3014 family protein
MNLDELELKRPSDPHIGLGAGSARRWWVFAILAAIIVLVATYWYLATGRPARQAQAPAAASASVERSDVPLGGQPEAIDVPPLDQSDPVVRTLVEQLSKQPTVLAWLATDGLIRNFTVVVDNIASGQSPAANLRSVRPTARFAVTGSGTALKIDPRSYDRYNVLADAVAGIDAQAASRVYATLKPRIEEANKELGSVPIDRKLEKAIVTLVHTKVPAGDVRVVPHGAEGYEFADGSLAALSDSQKLLVRMGPRNARLIQDKLREVGAALGIPEERLR